MIQHAENNRGFIVKTKQAHSSLHGLPNLSSWKSWAPDRMLSTVCPVIYLNLNQNFGLVFIPFYLSEIYFLVIKLLRQGWKSYILLGFILKHTDIRNASIWTWGITMHNYAYKIPQGITFFMWLGEHIWVSQAITSLSPAPFTLTSPLVLSRWGIL